MKLRGLVSNSYIYVSVSDLYISTISPSILLQQIILYKSLTDT